MRLPVAALLASLLLPSSVSSTADVVQERRAEAGVRLFRSLLAADMRLAEKVDHDGRLLLLVLYTDDRTIGERRAESLAEGAPSDRPPPIRDLPVTIELTSDPSFAAYRERRPAGIFLAQAPPPEALASVIRFGIQRRIIVYSPFEGHVERGVLAGLSVEARVRPYLNEETLRASGIELKEFFLKVTKVYP